MSGARSAVPRIFLAKAVRTYCYGSLGVLFPVHLAALGVGPRGIGIAITLTLGATAVMTVALRRPLARAGSRPVLLSLSGLIVLSALLFAGTRSAPLAVLAAMLGNLAVSVGESGPFLSIEQVLVARAVSGQKLTARMSLYNLVGYGAAGLGSLTVALVAPGGGPAAADPFFWLFALSGLAQLALYAGLPAATLAPATTGPAARPSRGLITRLAALFALDALAGGFVVQSLIAYWFFTRFGLEVGALGVIFFGTQGMTVASLLVAARVATRIGLMNTMVFSHLVSNGFLIAMAFAGTPAVAVALLLTRALLSQMDVPTRQAFLMAVVEDHEREAAATTTNAARTIAQAVSPALTGFIMQGIGLSAPFVLGGALKIVYDLLLYWTCRGRLPERTWGSREPDSS
jgi:predicted MFS family arabinose efflux permease